MTANGAAAAVRLQRKAKGERPQYFEEPAIDKVLSITMALAGEVAVMRDRMDSIERMLERGETPTKQALDAYKPSQAEIAERDAWREQFLEVVLRSIHQEREQLEQAAKKKASGSYDKAVEMTLKQ